MQILITALFLLFLALLIIGGLLHAGGKCRRSRWHGIREEIPPEHRAQFDEIMKAYFDTEGGE